MQVEALWTLWARRQSFWTQVPRDETSIEFLLQVEQETLSPTMSIPLVDALDTLGDVDIEHMCQRIGFLPRNSNHLSL